MSPVIYDETINFLLSVVSGGSLLFFYDLIRSFRRVWKHGMVAVILEDYLFCLFAGVRFFLFFLFRTDGVFRGYVAIGTILGSVLYYFTCSRCVVWIVSTIIGFIRHTFAFMWTFLTKPIEKNCHFLKKRIEFIKKSGYNKSSIVKKRGVCHGKKKKTE